MVVLRKLAFVVFALGVVSACSAPSADPPSGPAAAAAAPVLAPSAAAYITSATPGSSAAKTCSINGLRWGKRVTQINPTMVVSNDGFCGTTIHVDSVQFSPLMQVYAKPNHGRIDTFGADSARPGFRYYPDQGYVGTDTFVMVTGTYRHEIIADFSVTVAD
jgi:hypothetical protein